MTINLDFSAILVIMCEIRKEIIEQYKGTLKDPNVNSYEFTTMPLSLGTIPHQNVMILTSPFLTAPTRGPVVQSS